MLTLCNMHSMTRKTRALPHQRALLGQQAGNLAADQLIRDRLVRVRVGFVLVGNVPRTRRGAVVVGHGLDGVGVFSLLCVKGVAVIILGRAGFAGALGGVDLEDGVLGPVDVGVDAQTEEMLVVVRVDAWVDFGAPALGVLAGVHGVGVEDAGQLDFQLDRAVLVEDPVDAVLVVGRGEDLANDQLAGARDNDRVVAEIRVLEQNAVVFLVDADGVLDRLGRPGAVDELGVHVVDAAFAVAA